MMQMKLILALNHKKANAFCSEFCLMRFIDEATGVNVTLHSNQFEINAANIPNSCDKTSILTRFLCAYKAKNQNE